MNGYEIRWKRSAVKELRQLPKDVVTRILEAVEALPGNPFPPGVRKLAGAEHITASEKALTESSIQLWLLN